MVCAMGRWKHGISSATPLWRNGFHRIISCGLFAKLRTSLWRILIPHGTAFLAAGSKTGITQAVLEGLPEGVMPPLVRMFRGMAWEDDAGDVPVRRVCGTGKGRIAGRGLCRYKKKGAEGPLEGVCRTRYRLAKSAAGNNWVLMTPGVLLLITAS